MTWRRRPARLPTSILLPRRWRRSWSGVLLVLLIAFAAAYERGALPWLQSDRVSTSDDHGSAPPSRQQDLSLYHNRSFRIARVIDGDTVDLEIADGPAAHTRVRLWGVDTPEIRDPSVSQQHWGELAAKYVRNTVENRMMHVELSAKQTRDRFGRLLAYLYMERGGIMLNEQLIELGYGRSESRFPHYYSDRFKAAETRARRAAIGIWREPTPDVGQHP